MCKWTMATEIFPFFYFLTFSAPIFLWVFSLLLLQKIYLKDATVGVKITIQITTRGIGVFPKVTWRSQPRSTQQMSSDQNVFVERYFRCGTLFSLSPLSHVVRQLQLSLLILCINYPCLTNNISSITWLASNSLYFTLLSRTTLNTHDY